MITVEQKLALMKNRLATLMENGKNVKSPGVVRKLQRNKNSVRSVARRSRQEHRYIVVTNVAGSRRIRRIRQNSVRSAATRLMMEMLQTKPEGQQERRFLYGIF